MKMFGVFALLLSLCTLTVGCGEMNKPAEKPADTNTEEAPGTEEKPAGEAPADEAPAGEAPADNTAPPAEEPAGN